MTSKSSSDVSLELRKLSGWQYDQFGGYSLGYLLRKLPAHILSAKHEEQTWLFVERDDDGYGAGYQTVEGKTWELYCVADNPEDALAKLAIELFKQGVLKK
jgi:hypothetical protein